MDKNELLLAAMAAGNGSEFSPVQLQKLLFLIDRNVSGDLGGTGFTFVPYDYGPFDSSVYSSLSMLEAQGLAASSITSRGWKTHRLTAEGQACGQQTLQKLPHRAAAYIGEVASFVQRLSFSELVSAVYKAYPEMKVNSVFKG